MFKTPMGFLARLLALLLFVGVLPATAATSAAAADDPPLPDTVSADALPTWQVNGVVWSSVIVGTTAYVTGSFSKARPPGAAPGDPAEVAAANIFAFDVTTGLPVAFPHSLNAQGLVVRADPATNRLYVGGDFTGVDDVARGHVAAFDLSTGTLVETFAPSTNGQVRGLGFHDGVVYVGGNFRSASGLARTSLAAFDAADGSIRDWAPTATGGFVWAMVVTPGVGQVVVGGSFTALTGQNAYGMGALALSDGAVLPWAADERVRAAGSNGAVTSLSTDGSQVYGAAFAHGAGASFEGTFAAAPGTGQLVWVNDCLGDTYDIFPVDQVAYQVSHHHDCSAVDSFNDTNPRVRWQRAGAQTTYSSGRLWPGDAYGWNFKGLEHSTVLPWFPTLTPGTYTGASQAAWTVTGNADYVVLGGEFPKVNNVAQQGLTRFARDPLSPRASGPMYNTDFNPRVSSTEQSRVEVDFGTLWDRDDATLSYEVWRRPGGKIATVSAESGFWSMPGLRYSDTGLAPGGTYRYQISAVDPAGNRQWSLWSPDVTVSAAAPVPSAYAGAVGVDDPVHYWRLGESGSTLLRDAAGGATLTNVGMLQGLEGSLPGESDPGAGSAGGGPKMITKVPERLGADVSVEAWVRTTSIAGGRVVGFGDAMQATSTTGRTDRVLYLDAAGLPKFVVKSGPLRAVTGTIPINDGAWHHLVGVASAQGLELFVDGVSMQREKRWISTNTALGYWRLGADSTAGFPSSPGWIGLAGDVDEVAVYGSALGLGQVQAHFLASGRPPAWSVPAGANQLLTAAFTAAMDGRTLSVDGSGSGDPDQPVAAYAWDFGDGTTGTGATASHSYAQDGEFPVTLTVTDDTGAVASAVRPVTASRGGAPRAALTATIDHQTVTLDAGGSADADGDALTFAWDFGDGQDATGVSATHAYGAAGSYRITLTVTDATGATDSVTRSVQVTDGAAAPSAAVPTPAAPTGGAPTTATRTPSP